MLKLERDGDVFVATDPIYPGLLVVSKDPVALVNELVPNAIADLMRAQSFYEIVRDYEQ